MGVKRNGSWFKGDRTGDQDQEGRSGKTGRWDPAWVMSKCELVRPVTACAGNRGLIPTMLNGGHVSGSRADDELLIAPPPRHRAAVSLTSSGIWPSRSLSRCGPPGSASATSSVHRSPTLAQRLGKRGRVVLLFSHERILAAGVDSRAVVSSNLQVTSYWRHGSDDDP